MREPQYLTLLQLCNDVLRRFWTVAATVVLCAFAAAVVALVRPRTYTSSASFIGEVRPPMEEGLASAGSSGASTTRDSRGGGSRLARLLAGGNALRLPGSAATQPLDASFYYTTIRSPEVLRAVAASRFTIATPAGPRTVTPADVFRVAAGPADIRAEEAAERLGRALTVAYEERSGVLTLSVRSPHPGFSRAVATRLLDLLQERNRTMSDRRAEAQVAFLERTTGEARQALALVERRFARFLESNRAFVTASRLALEFQHLDTEVLDARRRYLDLSLQLERARLDRSRATQLVTVIVRPEEPARPDPRGTVRATIAGAIGGGTLALLIVLIRAHLVRLRSSGFPDLTALEAEWRSALRRRGAAGPPLLAAKPASAGGSPFP